jgi:probable aminopeptidase NPEPL1
MAGMKRDMAGAGAVLGAFLAAVKSGFSDNLHAILCLAENAVGPSSIRPDDILSMYSSKTVEVKNTDAEGRLVLADGVAYANQDLKSDVIVDLATLTGSQRTATGTRHAAIICNDSELEELTIQAGRSSGNLVHPLPYCPEFFRKEYRSKLADMQNVPKNRGNAPTCTGAQFVGEHLIDFTGQWLHVDLAAPSWSGERGTGFGVALLLELFCKDRD